MLMVFSGLEWMCRELLMETANMTADCTIIQAGDLKTKLELSPADDQHHHHQKPRKKQRVLTGTPKELVKLFGQYSQATTAANVRSSNPIKTMEYILDKAEKV